MVRSTWVCTVVLLYCALGQAKERPQYDVWRPLNGAFEAVEVKRYSNLGCARSRDGRVACWGREVGRRPSAPEITGNATPLLWHDIHDAIGLGVSQGRVCVARPAKSVTCLGIQNSVQVPAEQVSITAVEVVPVSNGFCGRTADGRVGCWGWIDWLETSESDRVVWIEGIAGAQGLSCGRSECCALDGDGRLHCFGRSHRILGALDGRTARGCVKDKRFKQAAIDGDRLCGVGLDDRLVCVAEEGTMEHEVPEFWKQRPSVRWVASGRQGCVVDRAGTLRCESGVTLSDVSQVSVTWSDGCAVQKGAVFCWGDGSTGGNGGGGDVVRALPGRVKPLGAATDLEAGSISTCALVDSSPHCWGVAPGSVRVTARPGRFSVTLAHLARTQQFASCGVQPDGEPWCDLGDGSHAFPRAGLPKSVRALMIDRVMTICALADNGRVSCVFSLGEAGLDSKWQVVDDAQGLVDLVPSAVGWCGRTRRGGVLCMEDHRFDDDPDFVDAPKTPLKATPIKGLNGVVQLAAGQNHYCARLKGGEVKCWGKFYYQGFGRRWHSKTPKRIPEFTGASDIASNHFHTCAVVGRKVRCWGENGHGQLGDGTFATRTQPVDVTLPAGVVPKRVAVGDRHSCLLDTLGRVWCWGDNSQGLLGDSRRFASKRPRRVVGIGSAPQSRPLR